MGQEDYILREIEKIGLMLRTIFNMLAGIKTESETVLKKEFEDANGQLLNTTGFNIEKLLAVKDSEVEEYLSDFKWISSANMELLADILKEMGSKSAGPLSAKYSGRALQLYELCNSREKAFSIDREGKIREIKELFNR